MRELDRAKVVIGGDSGVGKTALLHQICYQESLANPPWTIGCEVDVKIHLYKAGTLSERPHSIEFWDIGGSPSHANVRPIFYANLHGLILVHDLSNKKSEANLRKWLNEVFDKAPNNGLECIRDTTGIISNSHSFVKSADSFPVLVVGTKVDLMPSTPQQPSIDRIFGLDDNFSRNFYNSHCSDLAEDVFSRRPCSEDIEIYPSNCLDKTARSISLASTFAAERGFSELILSCLSPNCLSPGSRNAVILETFLDKVVTYCMRGNVSNGFLPSSGWKCA